MWRRFGGTFRLHLQGRRNNASEKKVSLHVTSTLKMEAKYSSETSVYNKPTRRKIPEDGILHSHRRDNLKSNSFVLVRSQFALTARSFAL
jgi:hypothetical protein